MQYSFLGLSSKLTGRPHELTCCRFERRHFRQQSKGLESREPDPVLQMDGVDSLGHISVLLILFLHSPYKEMPLMGIRFTLYRENLSRSSTL